MPLYSENLISLRVGLLGCLRFCRQPILFPYSTLLPRGWAYSITAFGNALRDFHPSEDRSELLPLLEAEAEQGYHCRQTILLRNGLPEPLLDGSNRYAPYRLHLMQASILHRWSWRTLRIAPSSADVIMLPDIHLSLRRKSPLT